MLEALAQHGFFPAAEFLAHPQDDGAALRHDGGVVNEDGVGATGLRYVMEADVDSGGPEQCDEGIVLFLRRGQIGPRCVPPGIRIGNRERRVGTAHEDRPKRIHHALASEAVRHRLNLRMDRFLLGLLPRGIRSRSAVGVK